eukprot:7550398-Lingulodinium_polyedra.AAC.1
MDGGRQRCPARVGQRAGSLCRRRASSSTRCGAPFARAPSRTRTGCTWLATGATPSSTARWAIGRGASSSGARRASP